MKDKILVTLKGKPIITQKDLDEEKEYWSQDSQLQELKGEEPGTGYIGSPAFERECLEGLIRHRIADEYVLSNKINETPDYQHRLSQATNNLHQEILRESIHVPITEDELRVLYEEVGSDRSFEEDRKGLELCLRKIKRVSYLDEKIEELREEFDVKIDEDFLR